MPHKYNYGELDFGDGHDFFAKSVTAIVLGGIIGYLFGVQVERIGILWSCVAGIMLFAVIGFRKQIRYFVRFLFSKQATKFL